jgi:NAD(P)H-dependent FMN reductase
MARQLGFLTSLIHYPTSKMLNIPVVLGSVREGRKSIFAANFILEQLGAKNITTQLVDFKELSLPFFEQALMPVQMKGQYPYPNAQKWSEIARAADGFVIVTPEYNHSYPAVLKNALDWLYLEFEKKPVALVGVSSGRFGGARAIEHLRPVMENYSMFAIRETVNFGPVSQAFDEQGKLIEERYIGQVNSLIDVLLQNAEVMKVLREKK